jgi:hypothetical protein
MIQINAFWGSGGGCRGASLMDGPSSVLKAPNEAQGPTVLRYQTTAAAVTVRPAAPEPRVAA